MFAYSPLINELVAFVNEPPEDATENQKISYQQFLLFVENCFRIPPDPTQAQPSSITNETVTVAFLKEMLIPLLSRKNHSMAGLVLEWLGANNAPTALVIHEEDANVIKIVLLSLYSIKGYNLCLEYINNNRHIPPFLPQALFIPVKVPEKLLTDTAVKYNLIPYANDSFIFSIVKYLPSIIQNENLVAGDLAKVFACKSIDCFNDDLIKTGKKIAQIFLQMWHINKNPDMKVVYMDPKPGNIRIDEDGNLLFPDHKGYIDGKSVALHLHEGEWCCDTTINLVFTSATAIYLPDYCDDPHYKKHFPIFKFYATAICKILFELITNISDRYIKEIIQDWEKHKAQHKILRTRLGSLILKGLENQIDNLEILIELFNDVDFLLEEGDVDSKKLPPPRNKIVLTTLPILLKPLPKKTEQNKSSNSDSESRPSQESLSAAKSSMISMDSIDPDKIVRPPGIAEAQARQRSFSTSRLSRNTGPALFSGTASTLSTSKKSDSGITSIQQPLNSSNETLTTNPSSSTKEQSHETSEENETEILDQDQINSIAVNNREYTLKSLLRTLGVSSFDHVAAINARKFNKPYELNENDRNKLLLLRNFFTDESFAVNSVANKDVLLTLEIFSAWQVYHEVLIIDDNSLFIKWLRKVAPLGFNKLIESAVKKYKSTHPYFNLDTPASYGRTALQLSLANGMLETAQTLLKLGAKVTITPDGLSLAALAARTSGQALQEQTVSHQIYSNQL